MFDNPIKDDQFQERVQDLEHLVQLMDDENKDIDAELKFRGDVEAAPAKAEAKTLRSLAESKVTGTAEEIKHKIAEANKAMATPIRAVMALEGTLGREISATANKLMQGVTAYQNARLLLLTLFSSFVDPMGIVVRGGEMKDAFNAFSRGVKMVVNGWRGVNSVDEMTELAQKMGIVGTSTYLDILGETYAGQYHGSSKIAAFNDALFRMNGMEAWNRAMRIQATGAAVGFIKKHLSNPTDESERYLVDELGLDPKFFGEYLQNGALDTDNPRVQQAVMKWVDGAILNPNASHRPILASDPHYQLVYHLKQFTYSFHNTILRRAAIEAKHGNYAPLVAMVGTYVPIIIAADVMKNMLIPGDDEPVWMRSLQGVVSHGLDRAALGGIPQMFGDALPVVGSGHPESLFGPLASQVVGGLSIPFTERNSVLSEGLGALPGGSVLKRYAQ